VFAQEGCSVLALTFWKVRSALLADFLIGRQCSHRAVLVAGSPFALARLDVLGS
jgi:hypothetical protein